MLCFDELAGTFESDNIKRLITLTVILLSCYYCSMMFYEFQQQQTGGRSSNIVGCQGVVQLGVVI